MRTLGGVIATLLTVLSLSTCSDVSALDVTPPPTEYYSPIFVSAFQQTRTTQLVSRVTTNTDSLDFVEFHNSTTDAINLNGWSIEASDQYGLICTVTLSSWILPDDFIVMARTGLGLSDGTGNIRDFGLCRQSQRVISLLTLKHNGVEEEQVAPTTGSYVRKGLTKTYRTGTFSKDFVTMSSSSRTSLYAGQWYEPLPETALQVVEVLARARSCSPLEHANDCTDYIKLYNPTMSSIAMDGLRLRVGYQGQSATSNNTFALSGTLAAGQYVVLTQEVDGSPLSVTNDGAWIWLEDSYGVSRYDGSVVSYPSASSDTKIGWAWAFDDSDDVWKWTTSPQPYDSPNVFTLPVEEQVVSTPSTLQPCAANQYRSPETNRCRLISSTTSTLQPCSANQYRSTETNRCRNISSSTSSLQVCAANQYRNPETNRCKAIAATASTQKPCKATQERNPETNRCRNKTIVTNADFPVQAIAQTGQATLGWWAFGGVGLLALGYAGWEWRSELMASIKKVSMFFTTSK